MLFFNRCSRYERQFIFDQTGRMPLKENGIIHLLELTFLFSFDPWNPYDIWIWTAFLQVQQRPKVSGICVFCFAPQTLVEPPA
jgi:hypothetical protein